jgi:hypothetical protein
VVNDDGTVEEQNRHLHIVNKVKTIYKAADVGFGQRLKVTFGDEGWVIFKDAMKLRNRVTRFKPSLTAGSSRPTSRPCAIYALNSPVVLFTARPAISRAELMEHASISSFLAQEFLAHSRAEPRFAICCASRYCQRRCCECLRSPTARRTECRFSPERQSKGLPPAEDRRSLKVGRNSKPLQVKVIPLQPNRATARVPLPDMKE